MLVAFRKLLWDFYKSSLGKKKDASYGAWSAITLKPHHFPSHHDFLTADYISSLNCTQGHLVSSPLDRPVWDGFWPWIVDICCNQVFMFSSHCESFCQMGSNAPSRAVCLQKPSFVAGQTLTKPPTLTRPQFLSHILSECFLVPHTIGWTHHTPHTLLPLAFLIGKFQSNLTLMNNNSTSEC